MILPLDFFPFACYYNTGNERTTQHERKPLVPNGTTTNEPRPRKPLSDLLPETSAVMQYLAVCAVLVACILIPRLFRHLDWVLYGQFGETVEDAFFVSSWSYGFWPHMTSQIWFLLGPAFALIALTPLLHCRRPRLSAFAVNVVLSSEIFLLFLVVVLFALMHYSILYCYI